MIKTILQLEGLFIFLLAVFTYQMMHGNWLAFLVLFMVPDVSMIGYIKDRKMGALTYNLVHNLVLCTALFFLGYFLQNSYIIMGSLILTAHVGADRLVGYGLKYPAADSPTAIKNTHLQKV